MALPVSSLTAADAYAGLRSVGRDIHNICKQLQEQIAAGTVYPAFLLDVLNQIIYTQETVPGLSEVAGLGTYARAQIGNPDLDLTAMLAETMAAILTLRDAIVAEYPRDAETGLMSDRHLLPDGKVMWVSMSASALPRTAAANAAFLATLD